MRTKFKYFFMGFLAAGILMWSLSAYAGELRSTIEVLLDYVNVVVDGKPKQVSNMVYNGSTYIKLRDISYVFGKDVEWDGVSLTAYIDEKDAVKFKSAVPLNGQQDYYPKYHYMNIAFSCDMKGVNDLSKVSLVSSKGERIPITSISPGKTSKDNLVFELGSELKLDTEYKFFIPFGAAIAADGKQYNREIDIRFKTAKTVLKGRIITNMSYSSIKTFTLTGSNKTYNPAIYDDFKFCITGLEGGKYTMKIVDQNGKVYEREVFVQDSMLNEVEFSIW